MSELFRYNCNCEGYMEKSSTGEFVDYNTYLDKPLPQEVKDTIFQLVYAIKNMEYAGDSLAWKEAVGKITDKALEIIKEEA
jgi:hypothetical protein